MRDLKRGVALLLLCFFAGLPEARADGVHGLGEAILHFVLMWVLVIHTFRALFIFRLPKWNWRVTLGRTLFVTLGLLLYTFWAWIALVFWSDSGTEGLFSSSNDVGRDLLWVGAYLINLLGLGIHIKYCIHNMPAPPAEP